MSVDVWSRPEACVAAMSVFRLAEEEPCMRPSDLEPAQRAAVELGEQKETVPRPVVERVMAELPEQDVARLVRLADELAPGRWGVLCALVGREEAAEPLLVGAVTAAVFELQSPPRWLAVMRETTADAAPGPLNVLATLVRPESVWSLGTARDAEALIPDTGALFTCAASRVEAWQLERVRLVAAPVARILPIDEAPRTTRDLAAALELLDLDVAATQLCTQLLVSYALRLAGLVPVIPSQN